jgi:tetratricopeptide (TPR) repeat protein
MRQYAAEHLDETIDANEIRRRHAAYYRSLVEQGSVVRRGLRYPPDMEVVRREHDNMRMALSTLLSCGDIDEGLKFCHALTGFWVPQGFMTEGEEWFHRFLGNADRARWEILAQSFYAVGRLAEYRGDFEAARNFHERSLSVAREHASDELAARALFGLGDVAFHIGRYDVASEHFVQGLSLGREAGILSDVAEALGDLGRIADINGQSERAREYLEEGLQIQRRLGDRWGVAYALHQMSDQLRREGNRAQAESMLEESHVLFRQAGSRMGVRSSVMSLATIALERDAVDRAAAFARESIELCRDMADASGTTARCVEIAAEVLLDRGEADIVLRLIAAADALRQVLGAPVPPDEKQELDRTLESARGSLTSAAFQDAYDSGARLSIHDAVELAADRLDEILAAAVH